MKFKVLLYSFLCLFCFNACKKLHTVAVVQSSYKSEQKQNGTHTSKDSIYIDRWHTVMQKGDTVFRVDSIYIIKTEQTHDTLQITYSDTIIKPQIVEVEKIVYTEKQLNKIQQYAIKSGYLLWLLVALLIGYKFLKVAKRFYGL